MYQTAADFWCHLLKFWYFATLSLQLKTNKDPLLTRIELIISAVLSLDLESGHFYFYFTWFTGCLAKHTSCKHSKEIKLCLIHLIFWIYCKNKESCIKSKLTSVIISSGTVQTNVDTSSTSCHRVIDLILYIWLFYTKCYITAWVQDLSGPHVNCLTGSDWVTLPHR